MNDTKKPVMTVAQLIEKLNALTDEQKQLEVWADGCDCIGPAKSIEVVEATAFEPAYVGVMR